ncbi:formin-like protein 6 [Iris pallida]|uniref:Formin-like protein 6 n=1 Tax=Iris pallida TaxID=29817 RepID=A0AAX6EYE7_IRIPA|nr:formin-like protein 6 [Iris pallida]
MERGRENYQGGSRPGATSTRRTGLGGLVAGIRGVRSGAAHGEATGGQSTSGKAERARALRRTLAGRGRRGISAALVSASSRRRTKHGVQSPMLAAHEDDGSFARDPGRHGGLGTATTLWLIRRPYGESGPMAAEAVPAESTRRQRQGARRFHRRRGGHGGGHWRLRDRFVAVGADGGKASSVDHTMEVGLGVLMSPIVFGVPVSGCWTWRICMVVVKNWMKETDMGARGQT